MCIQRQPAELLVGHDAPLGLHVSRESLFGTDPRLDPEGVLSVLRRVPRRVKRILDDLLSRKGQASVVRQAFSTQGRQAELDDRQDVAHGDILAFEIQVALATYQAARVQTPAADMPIALHRGKGEGLPFSLVVCSGVALQNGPTTLGCLWVASEVEKACRRRRRRPAAAMDLEDLEVELATLAVDLATVAADF